MTIGVRLSIMVLTGAMLAGCSSNSGTPTKTNAQSTGSGQLTALKVGTSPTLSNASLFLASEDGTFSKNKLSVATQVMTSGAQAVPLLLNGQIQFTAADPVGAIVAISKNAPLVIVAQGNVVPANPAKDAAAVLVKPDSGINTAKDLAGKTLAVNALGSLAQIGTEKSIDLAGGDSSKVKFVELPIPQMVAAVKGGQVDGAVPSEPYVTKGKDAGLKNLMPVLSKAMPGAPMLVYVSSKTYVDKHPDVVKAFADSIYAANTVLSTNDNKIREIGAKSTQEKPDELAKIVVPTFVSTRIDSNVMKTVVDIMVAYKVLVKPIDVTKYIFKAS